MTTSPRLRTGLRVNDFQRESDRLDVVHHIMVRSMKGKIYLAPINEDKVQNILDVGTGTGSCKWRTMRAVATAWVLSLKSGY